MLTAKRSVIKSYMICFTVKKQFSYIEILVQQSLCLKFLSVPFDYMASHLTVFNVYAYNNFEYYNQIFSLSSVLQFTGTDRNGTTTT